jgi:type IV pilus assembly protein PilA
MRFQKEILMKIKKTSQGFTLIELLVVVAIIGILAAVGVVAYNGYTESAKKNALKTVGAQTVKYMQAEITKCTLDSNATILGSQACGSLSTANAITAMTNKDDKSPVYSANKVYKSGSAYEYGYVVMQATDAKTITVRTCWASGCATADATTNTVTIE